MQTEPKPGFVRHDFAGLSELVDWIEKTPRSIPNKRNWSSTSGLNRAPDWDFDLGYKGSLKLVQTGWADGAKKIEKLRNEQVGEIAATWESVTASDWVADVVGEELDLGKYLEGDPECYLDDLETDEVQYPVLDVWFKGGGTCNVTAEDLFAQGVALLAAVEKIEAKGIRVKLTAWFLSESAGRYHAATVVIKRPEDTLQLPALAFGIAHPAFFRRLVFALRERQGESQTRVFCEGGSYGRTVHGDLYHKFPGLMPKNAVCIAPDLGDSIEVAYGKIVQTLERKLAPAA